MHLSDLLDLDGLDLEGLDLEGKDNPIINGVSCDSRQINKGFVFVAIKGTSEDGNRFIDDAIKNGAAAIITDTSFDQKPVPVIAVEDSRIALANMANRLHRKKPNLLATVTGTNGKTSVAEFLRQIWLRMGWQAGSIGTLGVRSGHMEMPIPLTTPDALTLHKSLEKLSDNNISHVALEASSHGIEQHRLSQLPIAVAGFTNLSRDHLDHHKTIEAYFTAKLRLFTELLADGGTAVINTDNEYGKAIIKAISGRQLRIITVGHDDGSDFQLMENDNLPWGQLVSIKHNNHIYKVPLALLGEFQGENAVLAAAMAHASGLSATHALLSLPYLMPASGRMHSIFMPHNTARVVVDYAHTPDALDTVLKTLRQVTHGKLYVVFGCGGNRDKGKRIEMGKSAASWADKVIVTDDNPRNEDPSLIRADVMLGCPDAKNIADRAKAIAYGIDQLNDGDILLIAGKGHENQQLIGDETLPFSDEGTVRAILRSYAAGEIA